MPTKLDYTISKAELRKMVMDGATGEYTHCIIYRDLAAYRHINDRVFYKELWREKCRYVKDGEDIDKIFNEMDHGRNSKVTVVEVYNYNLDLEKQLDGWNIINIHPKTKADAAIRDFAWLRRGDMEQAKVYDYLEHVIEDAEDTNELAKELSQVSEKQTLLEETNAKNRKSYNKRIMSLILAVSLFTGGMVGTLQVRRLAKTQFAKTTNVLSSTGENYSNLNSVNSPVEDKVFAKIMAKDNSESDYQFYDISDANKESIEGYYDYALNTYNIDLNKYNLEVEQTTYVEYKNQILLVLAIIGYIFLTVIVLIMLDQIDEIYDEEKGFLGYISIRRIKEVADVIRNGEKLSDVTVRELEGMTDALSKKIAENDKLKAEFDKYYEANKQLLKDSDKVLRLIDIIYDDLINKNEVINKVKTLAKERD